MSSPKQTPLNNAWDWSVRKSPVLFTWRAIHHKLHPQQRAAERLQASELPAPVQETIAQMVQRTRLRSIERDQVCHELIDHATDALASNTDPQQVASALGDPKAAAPLIRRAMKRKRSAFYQARVYLTRATLIGFTTLVLVYLGLFIRFHAGSPNIKTDYLAQLNAPILAVPEQDRAVTVYQDVLESWRPTLAKLRALPNPEYANEHGDIDNTALVDYIPSIIKLDHPHFSAVRDAFMAFRPELDRLHEASQRQTMGYVLTTTPINTDGEPIGTGEPVSPLFNGALVEILLPHLGQVRHTARLLSADARLAAMDRDAQRVTDDIAAIANTSRLMSGAPFLITNVVSVSIQALAVREISLILADQPDLLTAEQLLTLSHTLAAARDKNLAINLRGESYIFEDTMQRVFTDNGKGDGRLAPGGLDALITMASWKNYNSADNPKPSTLSKLAGPLSMEFIASRAEITRLYHDQLAVAQQTLAQGPSSLPTLQAKIDELENMNPVQGARYLPITAVLPAFKGAIYSVFKARTLTDATLVALAAESFRREHGEYPSSIDQLVPQYLPTLPPDAFDPGQPMKYKLTSTGPMIYVNGADGDDDNGTPFPGDGPRRDRRGPEWVQSLDMRYPSPSHNYKPIPSGDWILFPTEEN